MREKKIMGLKKRLIRTMLETGYHKRNDLKTFDFDVETFPKIHREYVL